MSGEKHNRMELVMRVSPVSFGKVIEVKDKRTAYNIAALANSKVENKAHRTVQKEAKKLLNDITQNGPARAVEYDCENIGTRYFILSGKDTEQVAKYFDEGRKRIYDTKDRMDETIARARTVANIKNETKNKIKEYISINAEPYTVSVVQDKGDFHLRKSI